MGDEDCEEGCPMIRGLPLTPSFDGGVFGLLLLVDELWLLPAEEGDEHRLELERDAVINWVRVQSSGLWWRRTEFPSPLIK